MEFTPSPPKDHCGKSTDVIILCFTDSPTHGKLQRSKNPPHPLDNFVQVLDFAQSGRMRKKVHYHLLYCVCFELRVSLNLQISTWHSAKYPHQALLVYISMSLGDLPTTIVLKCGITSPPPTRTPTLYYKYNGNERAFASQKAWLLQQRSWMMTIPFGRSSAHFLLFHPLSRPISPQRSAHGSVWHMFYHLNTVRAVTAAWLILDHPLGHLHNPSHPSPRRPPPPSPFFLHVNPHPNPNTNPAYNMNQQNTPET